MKELVLDQTRLAFDQRAEPRGHAGNFSELAPDQIEVRQDLDSPLIDAAGQGFSIRATSRAMPWAGACQSAFFLVGVHLEGLVVDDSTAREHEQLGRGVEDAVGIRAREIEAPCWMSSSLASRAASGLSPRGNSGPGTACP